MTKYLNQPESLNQPAFARNFYTLLILHGVSAALCFLDRIFGNGLQCIHFRLLMPEYLWICFSCIYIGSTGNKTQLIIHFAATIWILYL